MTALNREDGIPEDTEPLGNFGNHLCAYCGIRLKTDREHVFPKCLYTQNAREGTQMVTVPACNQCNNSWSSDEVVFRNILTSICSDKAIPKKLWKSKIRRSLKQQCDGWSQLQSIFNSMVPVVVNGVNRHKIFPGKNKSVIRVVSKIARGLCHYHGVMTAVSEDQVFADVMRYVIPKNMRSLLAHGGCNKDVAEYEWAVLNQNGIQSCWILTFYQRVKFIAIVSMPTTNTQTTM